ncbi:amidohydrolase (plasmid) [Ensifer sp. PDNC004]|uniref:M20 aminoacylase family protein n=1 Tax=Ensifer sp. PDNC004 TaxID=2811423 RepID=UPI001965FB17|nr:M20 aminoacylase family protein [Ensifer sp. PDNC004]QRY70667.1 amidohydrolase [Ensifer sp. PDNC004]
MNLILTDTQRSAAVERGLASFIDEIVAIRRDLHQHPELAFQERRTSDLVADRLSAWGYEVSRGIARTGIVATLRRGRSEKAIGLRADMDALPIEEATGLAYASRHKGVMHACGHDGHTAILLAAARFLAGEGRFDGTLRLIFQPAEEIGAGARSMLSEGLLERFPVEAIFGLHNWPGVATGRFGFVEGPAMASVDQANITVVGKGGHGAEPHLTVDPVLATASLITALQSLVSRNVDPQHMAVVTVGSIRGGQASNVIPESVSLKLTLRAFNDDVRRLLGERVQALARAQAESFGARAEIDYRLGFPALVNHAAETDFARDVALKALGPDAIISDFKPRTASEDFAFFLEEKAGNYAFVGNGDSAALHSAEYDFNDAIIAPAARYWVRLVETFLA